MEKRGKPSQERSIAGVAGDLEFAGTECRVAWCPGSGAIPSRGRQARTGLACVPVPLLPKGLAGEDWAIAPAAVAALTPNITERIKRYGKYATDGHTIPPATFDPRLDLSAPVASEAATTADQAA
jgi:hypothetical protein